MNDKPLKVYPGPWSTSVVCGASGTGRTRFAYALADKFNGHVIDTSDVLEAARTMTGPEQHPELFYVDAEDRRGFDDAEAPGAHPTRPSSRTAEELAGARLRAADVLTPAVQAVLKKQPRLHLDGNYEFPHTVVTGRHALPGLGWDVAVILTETEEQIHANLASRYRRYDCIDLRVQTSTLVQRELIRRAHEHKTNSYCGIIHTDARPWQDAVERTTSDMGDLWDLRNALG